MMSSTMIDSQSETAEKQSEAFEFTGNASEYFKIWIVNVCLSILTLGIYSAWAKVRTTQYFYGNTKLAGASFGYTAKPEVILKGRAIAVIFLAVGYAILSYAPQYEYVSIIAMVLVTPWLMVRSLSFRARNTTYRNIRFGFQGTYSQAIIVYWGCLLFITIITGGLAYPWALNKKQQFIINHSQYGTKRFSFSPRTGAYYATVIKAYFLGAIVIYLAFSLFQKMNGFSILMQMIGNSNNGWVGGGITIIGISYTVVVLFIATYTNTRNKNITLSAVKIDQISLRCNLSVSKMLWLYSSNIIAIICSMGLLIPWAKIRVYQYRMDSLKLKGLGTLDDFIASSAQDQQAIGEGITDIFDVEIGL